MMNLDPKKMQAMMRQMGIKQEEIEATRVVIEKTDGKQLIIENPSVQQINMQGNTSFQIAGEVSEQESSAEPFSEEDIQTVVDKTGCTHDQAKKVLESTNGDLAEAILELSE